MKRRKLKPALGTFAADFKLARKAAGLTQIQAADLLEVNRRSVQLWEEGKIEPILPARIGVFTIFGTLGPGEATE